ncbi:MAG: hypothetical protein ACE5EX_03110, partial [Phycisphaerae bacterium]
GDLDGSQTVDLADLGGLIRCLQGPCDRMGCQAPIVEGVCCNVADTDVDRDVDLADVAEFQRMFGRP